MPAAPARASVEEEAVLDRRINELTLHANRLDPSDPAAGLPVLDRMLVAVGDDPHSSLALAWANELAPLFAKHVTLAHVDTPMADLYYADVYRAYFPPEEAPQREREGRQRLDLAKEELRDFDDVDLVQPQGVPVPELVDLARERRAHLVLVGSLPESGLERWLLKSTAQGLKDHAPCSVLLAKTAPFPGDILCAVDGSWMSKRAAILAYRMTRAWGSTLRLLHVLKPPSSGGAARFVEFETAILEKLRFPWDEPRGVDYALRVGDPPQMILDETERAEPVLLVMGSRGLSGLRSLVAGSVTDRVAHHAKASMIIVK